MLQEGSEAPLDDACFGRQRKNIILTRQKIYRRPLRKRSREKISPIRLVGLKGASALSLADMVIASRILLGNAS